MVRMSSALLCACMALLVCAGCANMLNPHGEPAPLCMVARAGAEWRAVRMAPHKLLATARVSSSPLGNSVARVQVRAFGDQETRANARQVAYCAGYLEGMLTADAAQRFFAAQPPPEPSPTEAAALRAAVERAYADGEDGDALLALGVMQLRGMRDAFNAALDDEHTPRVSASQLLMHNVGRELRGLESACSSSTPRLSASCVHAMHACDGALVAEARAEGRARVDGSTPALVHRVVSGFGYEVATLAPPLVLVDDVANALWITSAGLSVSAASMCTEASPEEEWIPRAWRIRAALHSAASAEEWARAMAAGGEHSQYLVRDWKSASSFGTALAGFLSVVERGENADALAVTDVSRCVPGRTVRTHVDSASGEQTVVSWSDPLLQSYSLFSPSCALHNGTSAAVAAAAHTLERHTRCDLHRRSPHAHNHLTTRLADARSLVDVLDTHPHKFFTPRFLDDGSAATVLLEHGWAASDDIHEATLVWLRGEHEFEHVHLQDGQLLNMLAGQVELTTKDRLSRHLAAVGAVGVQPRTFHVFLPDECERFRAHVAARRGRGDVWIQKLSGESMGVGMVIREADATDWVDVVAMDLNGCRANSASTWMGEKQRVIRTHDEKVIMQRYITNPLLVEGRKWELRAYWAVLSVEPLLVVFTEAGTRRNAEPFQLGDWGNSRVHLTNTAQQAGGEADAADLKWSWGDMRAYLAEHRPDVAPPGWWEETLLPACKEQLRTVLRATRESLVRARGEQWSTRGHAFQLFRSDWIVDDDGHPWLTEAQLSPALSISPGDALKQRIIPPMLTQLFNLVLEVHARRSVDGVGPLDNMQRDDAVWEWLWREGDA